MYLGKKDRRRGNKDKLSTKNKRRSTNIDFNSTPFFVSLNKDS